jgi:predicted metalloprotease with PDZ domain
MRFTTFILTLLFFLQIPFGLSAQKKIAPVEIELSFPEWDQHRFHVNMHLPVEAADSIVLQMPQWTPGYYQLMKYGEMVENFRVGASMRFRVYDNHTWIVYPSKQRSIHVSYDVKTDRKFVAKSWVDSQHAYIVPAGAFLYVKYQLSLPVKVKVKPATDWPEVATGLDPTSDRYTFTARDFDILYDCPLSLGKLESLPSHPISRLSYMVG